MSKIVKTIAPLCSIYDVYFRNLMVEHELEVGEDLNGKVGFLLADPPYKVRRVGNDDHAEYDVFGSSDMKDMAKIFKDVMKPGGHGHVFSSAL